MSILEKILKNKKGGLVVQDESQNLSDKIILNNEIEITNHKKSVLEDGRLYDTSKAEKTPKEKSKQVLPDEPIDAASMLINATITVEPSKSGTFSPLHDKEPQTFAKYDINQLREIAEHLLTYCNAQERGCKDACGKNCEP